MLGAVGSRAAGRKGVGAHIMWLVFGMILLVLTAALLYVIFPRSDCDRMAEVSAQEIKSAIECAAKYDDAIDPATGKKCNEANVRLCQEDKFSIYGVGYIQAYMGLMVPEYMIYYQKFPTQRYKLLFEGPVIGFTESYPFERAYVGQRPYDIRPTLTQFKQFFKTRYLEKGCTSEQGLCLNIRGREEVVRVDGYIPDVRLLRNGVGFAETNPKFYLVAPCHAKVVFTKGAGGEIYGRPMKYSTPGASNYCFMDETKLLSLMVTYTSEAQCEIGMIALDFISLGSKKAVQEGAEAAATAGVKAASKAAARKMAREVSKDVIGKYWVSKQLGKTAQKEAAELAFKRGAKEFLVRQLEEEPAKRTMRFAAREGLETFEFRGGKRLAPKLEKEAVEEAVESAFVQSKAYEETLEGAMKRSMKGAVKRSMTREALAETPVEILADDAQPVLQGGISRGLRDYFVDVPADQITEVSERISTKLAKETDRPIEEVVKEGIEEGAKDLIGPITGRDLIAKGVVEETSEAALESVAADAGERVGGRIATQMISPVLEEAASAEAESIVAKGLTAGSKGKLAAHALFQRYATMEGLPVAAPTKTEKILWMFGAVPCLDIDVCRAGSACAEATMWPGGWFGQVAELTDKHMKKGKISDTVSDVFFECCNELNYGAETDPEKIICTEPAYIVELIKPDFGLNETENLTLAMVADYLELPPEEIPISCSLSIGDNSKDCRDAMEIRELKLTDTCAADVSEHTYDFGGEKQAGQITVMARLYKDAEDCPAETNIMLELSNDTKDWLEVNRTTALPFPEDNFVYALGKNTFRYVKVSEDGACYLDSSSVVLDPVAGKVMEALPNTRYELAAGVYNYFIVPEGYTSKASTLCNSIRHCTTMAKWVEEEGGWLKWADEGAGPVGEDFTVLEGDKIGIYTTGPSEVKFPVE